MSYRPQTFDYRKKLVNRLSAAGFRLKNKTREINVVIEIVTFLSRSGVEVAAFAADHWLLPMEARC
jgi:hypothetical protein